MGRPRVIDPNVAEARKREQTDRKRIRDRLLAVAFRDKHPTSYAVEAALIDDLIEADRGPIPGEPE